jgi:class 3 adenylate cyclase
MRASTVLFLDVVGYSKFSMAERHAIKRSLNADIRLALVGFPLDETVMVDTGDGVALTFLNDVEQALLVASKVAQQTAKVTSQHPRFELRMGIHVGPIKRMRDINAQPNVIGDGINTAQRIMSFAAPGQVLVSRAYYEMVSVLSARYRDAFLPAGRKFDKHKREHDVYEFCPAALNGSAAVARLPTRRRWMRAGGVLIGSLMVSLMILGGCLLRQRAVPTVTETPAPAASGVIKFAVSPWGEVVIDGKPHGASPPLREVRVKPGLHRVEVSNGTSKPYVETVRLASDEVATLRHRF